MTVGVKKSTDTLGNVVPVHFDQANGGVKDDIRAEVQSLAPDALIELFVLDFRDVKYLDGSGVVKTLYGDIASPTEDDYTMRFHAGTNSLSEPIIWQRKEYIPLPVEATGFAMSTTGASPRPKLKLANTDGMFSALVAMADDLIGCKVIRKRTFAKYLDDGNFPDDKNPNYEGINSSYGAYPDVSYPDEIWIIDQKTSENRFVVEWDLASAYDLNNVSLPSRLMLQNNCPFVYRSADCGWQTTSTNSGPYFDKNDNSCTANLDSCGKRLSSCKARFGKTNELRFGGFPGLVKYTGG